MNIKNLKFVHLELLMTRWTILLFSITFLLIVQQSKGQVTSDYARYIMKADSFLLLKDYTMAHHYYCRALELKPNEALQKLTYKKITYVDSILANEVLDSFISFKYGDSLFNAGIYRRARISYGHSFFVMYPYVVNKEKLLSLNEYISKQIKICDEKLTLDELVGIANTEECDGPDTDFCVEAWLSVAKKAEKQKDYQTAVKYYELGKNTDKMEEMKKLLKK
ncbi:MAG: hypothetical protein ACT4ON_08755 [Bacteroidota bacterium]